MLEINPGVNNIDDCLCSSLGLPPAGRGFDIGSGLAAGAPRGTDLVPGGVESILVTEKRVVGSDHDPGDIVGASVYDIGILAQRVGHLFHRRPIGNPDLVEVETGDPFNLLGIVPDQGGIDELGADVRPKPDQDLTGSVARPLRPEGETAV